MSFILQYLYEISPGFINIYDQIKILKWFFMMKTDLLSLVNKENETDRNNEGG